MCSSDLAGSRKPKGQAEVRRTLYNDPVRVLGEMPAGEEIGRASCRERVQISVVAGSEN